MNDVTASHRVGRSPCAYLRGMASFYQSPAVKERVLQLYDEKLTEIPLDVEHLDVPTQFGNTHVLRTGRRDGPIAVLLHGANAMAPIALEAMRGLAQDFQLIVPDIPGQPNRSAETRISMRGNDYGAWCNEVLMEMDLQDVTLVGASLGGMISLKTLLDDESRIRRAYLLMPAFIVNGNPLKTIWKVYLPMRRYGKTSDAAALDEFVDGLFTDADPFAPKFFDAVFGKFEMDQSWVPTITRREAQSLNRPVTIFGAADDLFFPGEKMGRRVRKVFPAAAEFVLLEHSKHVPGKVQLEKITQKILSDLMD